MTMKISIDLSLYPLDKNYSGPIRDLLSRLSQYRNVEVRNTPMSTQITGDFNACMHLLQTELKHSFSQGQTMVSVIKMVNLDMEDN